MGKMWREIKRENYFNWLQGYFLMISWNWMGYWVRCRTPIICFATFRNIYARYMRACVRSTGGTFWKKQHMCQLAKGEALPVATPHKHTQTTFRCTQHQSGSLSFLIFLWGESKNPWLSDAKSCGLRGCGASSAEGQADWEGERGKEDFSPRWDENQMWQRPIHHS